MKIHALFLTLAFIGFCHAQETKTEVKPANPEIEKIDARLAELTTIWKYNTAVINGLTNNKRTPVQEGSQAYFKCVEAAKKIQQAEAEAKLLKANRLRLSGGSGSTTPTANENLDTRDRAGSGNLNQDLNNACEKMREFWNESLQTEIAKKSSVKGGSSDEPEKSTQEERAAIAKKLLANLDTRNFLHPLESYSPTLKFIGAKLTLQGKNLSEINAYFDKEDWLGLLGFLNEKPLAEYPTIKTYNKKSPSIEGLARILAEKKLFLRLSPVNPAKPILRVPDGTRYTIPHVMLPQAIKEWDAPLLYGRANGGFSEHPDGELAGYLKEWNPQDGPVILILPMRAAYFLPVARILESTTGPSLKSNFFAEKEAFSKGDYVFTKAILEGQADINKKVEIGELSEAEAASQFLQFKEQKYRETLKYWIQW